MPAGTTEYVQHPLIEPTVLEARPYQAELVAEARRGHTLVSLPTGLGKTAVSLRITAHRLADRPDGRALLLAPTKPLVEQHANFYRRALTIPAEQIVVFTGDTRPDDRSDLFEDARVVVATPQVIENDLVGNRISLTDVVHCTFDECHRATGNYPYTYIAKRYHADASEPLVTGMSASPGDDKEAILQVCRNLGISNVAVKTESDSDVATYTYKTEVEWRSVELPEAVIEIRDHLEDVIRDRLETLAELGVSTTTSTDLSQSDLDTIRRKLQRLIDDGDSAGFEGMSLHAEVMKVRRAVELVETQSVDALGRYFERQRNAARSSGASKAAQRFVSDPRVQTAMRLAEDFDDLHPKFRHTRMLLAETLGIEGGDRVIVFTESRDTAEALTDFLDQHFDVRRFVGQGDRDGSDGMTQREQQETLEAFREGEFDVLVSTSVAEEGLDVPEVDLVLFFEPVPTAIRSVQRKGRTGRQTEGRVVVLMAEDTRDEAFFWISRRREEEMEEELRTLKNVADELESTLQVAQAPVKAFEEPDEADEGASGDESSVQTPDSDTSKDRKSTSEGRRLNDEIGRDRVDQAGQSGLTDFESDRQKTDETTATDHPDADPGEQESSETQREGAGKEGEDEVNPAVPETVVPSGSEENVEIVIDQRELDSPIARDLSTRESVETRLETLEVGDYVVSDRVAVERKTIGDFLSTLLEGDRSLFDQAGDLSRAYTRPVLLLEGEADLYTERNVHPNAIRGALASLVVDFNISILRARDEADTADLLETIATREQEADDREVSLHGEKAAKTLAEQQEYVVSSIADIGPVTARSLLEALGSVEAVLTAEKEKLLEVGGVGSVTADRIREVVGSEYDPH